MRIKNQKKKAFTLIELMLALAFLGTLLLSVAMLAMRLVDMYTKGSTMRAVNSVGSAIIDDMRSHVSESGLWTTNLQDGSVSDKGASAAKQYYKYHTYKVNEGTTEEESFVDYGAFCTNSYTYIFNHQAAMLRYRDTKNTDDKQSYLMIGTDSDHRPYALARIRDSGCTQFKLLNMTNEEVVEYNNATTDESKKLPDYNSAYFMQGNDHFLKVDNVSRDVTILLDGTQSDEGTDLQIYDFSVMSAVQSRATNQALFDIAFVLGTTRGGINVKSSNNYCSKNSKASQNAEMANYSVDYCSVNRFEFVVRQTGEK